MKTRTTSKTRGRGRTTAPVSRRGTVPARGRSNANFNRRSAGRTERSAKRTTNHEQIRKWVEARGGHPAKVKRTAKGGQRGGILRIDFPGFSGATSLKAISWDEWFDIFEDRNLAFLYQTTPTPTGKTSRFNKLVSRES